jgi:hypothetical protein
MNNSKLVLFLSCVFAVTLTAPLVTAAPRGGGHFSGGHHSASMPGRAGMGTWSGRNWSGRNWSGGNWHGRNWNNWGGNWHHHHGNNVIFIGDFGFPWWWGWGWGPWWGWDGGYGYYGYGYPYGSYGYGYGYGYGGQEYGAYGDTSRSRVAELQRRLARAGYYHGSIDGILGPQTRRAIRAYERDRGYAS